MANKYWVGGSGNWSDTNHWSLNNDGSGSGAGAPTSSDNAIFNQFSFTAGSKTVTIDGVATCADMDWTNATNTPTFTGTSTKTLNIAGSLTFISAMTESFAGTVNFTATSTGKTITTANKFKSLSTFSLSFTGTGGGWTLQDDFIVSCGFIINAGTFNTNNQNINSRTFTASGAGAKTLNLGSSTITATDNVTISATNITFNAQQSTIKMTGTGKTFTGSGLTYNILEITGNNCIIDSNNTIATLKLTPNTTVKFTAGTTQTITNWSGDGTLGNLITIISATPGTFYTINKSSGLVTKLYYSITDCHVGGGATFRAYKSTDVSGNAGWATISAGEVPANTRNLRCPRRKFGSQLGYIK